MSYNLVPVFKIQTTTMKTLYWIGYEKLLKAMPKTRLEFRLILKFRLIPKLTSWAGLKPKNLNC